MDCNHFRSPYDLETVIMLEGSEHYDFIHVEQYGYVKSYDPTTSSGDHHHLMFIRYCKIFIPGRILIKNVFLNLKHFSEERTRWRCTCPSSPRRPGSRA